MSEGNTKKVLTWLQSAVGRVREFAYAEPSAPPQERPRIGVALGGGGLNVNTAAMGRAIPRLACRGRRRRTSARRAERAGPNRQSSEIRDPVEPTPPAQPVSGALTAA